MYKRERDTTKFSDLGVHEYDDFEEFMSNPISEGLSTISFGSRVLDFFYEDRGASVTFITFTAAISPKIVKYPIFSSRAIASRLNTNFLSFADPASGGDKALATFWHLGTAEIPSHEIIPKVISKAMSEGSGEQMLFFGSSAGGFAALNYSAQFLGSAALVMNPRINVLNAPKHAPRYIPVTFPGAPLQEAVRALPYNQAAKYGEPQGNFVVYLQNMQDELYKRNHYAHFVKAVEGRDDVHFVTDDWGQGHVVPPLKTYESLLSDLVRVAPSWGEISGT
ncbi:hypothetical protein ACT3UA_18845 [Glutamicibacter sp. 363]|uniref:hypothetical protein n=1 Tax=Glutamicibacter sp. 363 TaxID=3457731 RepID=UPI004034C30A